ncbi:GTPase IMAP family member 8-like protein [Labeo rohita]|uniref:GTPase IMAP family member 8-like protein n=1 Tax=Labeo rohita TaxID=84645 RepID=A0A498P0W8_LABRO|nr:GTPase IMAP family member 8-like protein [Labeo rohita]
MKIVLKEFSEEAVKRTIVITTDEEKHHASVKVNEFIQQLTAECGEGHVQYKNDIKFCCSEIFKRIEKIPEKQEINDEYLRCDTVKDAPNIDSSVDKENSGSVDSDLKKMEEQSSKIPTGVSATRKQKLNLVLCGSNGRLKTYVSNLITEKKNVELHEHMISLVELCDPGVDVFLIITSDAPLSNEDTTEMEGIQKRFSSKINKHTMILKIKQKNIIMQTASEINPKTSLQMFGGQHFTLENSLQVPALLQEVENMVQENGRSCYTTFMYLQAQVELERNKYRLK